MSYSFPIGSPLFCGRKFVSKYSNCFEIFECGPTEEFLGEVYLKSHHSALHNQVIQLRFTFKSEIKVAATIIHTNWSFVRILLIIYKTSYFYATYSQVGWRFVCLQLDNETTTIFRWRRCIVRARGSHTWIGSIKRHWELVVRVRNLQRNFYRVSFGRGLADVFVPSPVFQLTFLSAVLRTLAPLARL